MCNKVRSVVDHKVFMKTSRILLILIAALGCTFNAFSEEAKEQEKLRSESDAAYFSWVGKPAQVKFTAVDGREVDLQKMRGKVVLLDFWATWCGPCRKEIPHVKAMYDKWHAKGFEIIGVSFDSNKQALIDLVQQEKMPWPQYFEGRKKNALGDQFGIQHYPSMWMVDKKGIIRYISAGADMEEKIQTLLKEPGVAGAATPIANLDEALKDLKLKKVNMGSYPTAMIETSVTNYTVGARQSVTLKTSEGDLWVYCISVTTNATFLSMKGRSTAFKLALDGGTK